jgi:MSHA biogenesis protein MshI
MNGFPDIANGLIEACQAFDLEDLHSGGSVRIFGGQPSSAHGVTGVSQENAGIALAHVTGSRDKPHLSCCTFFEGGLSANEDSLQEVVKDSRLVRSRAVGVVGFGSYGLFQVSPPPVPDDEMRDAVRWQIKDLVDYPLDEAVVDVFQVGADRHREGAKDVYVVVARKSVVWQQIELMRHARLKIDAIDIPELSLRNLAVLLPEDARGVSLLHLGVDRGVVIVCRGGRLQLARDIPFGTAALSAGKDLSEPDGYDDNSRERLNSLALDIQRSLDYYESSFRQTPVAALYVLPSRMPLPDLLPELQNRLGTPVKPYVLGDVLSGERETLLEADKCLLAVGAALRNDKEEA